LQISLLQSKCDDKDNDIESLKKSHVSLRQASDEQCSRMNELTKKLTQESDLTAKTLQKAISSSVRLCVVAPTVNVHVADKKMRFQTK
jgi:hypothetical protein